MRRYLGYTLVEVLIASVLALMVLVVLIRMLWFAWDLDREVSSSYLVRADAEVAFRQIQDDLRLTHLSALRVASNDAGFSCPSPLKGADRSSFELTPFGVCRWKSWVHYTVLPRGNYVGNLVRWEAEYPKDAHEPMPSTFKATDVRDEVKASLLTDVVQPGIGLVPRPTSAKWEELGPVSAADGGGGLRVRFVRYENGKEVLTTVNPALEDDETKPGWSKGTTSLVDCRLQVADKASESGRWSVYTMAFRVSPRN